MNDKHSRNARTPSGNHAWFTVAMALHVLLAVYVTFILTPFSQDSPSHLYAGHVLRALAHGEPWATQAFENNLHPIGNSLFFLALTWTDGVASVDLVASAWLLGSLILYPLSVFALSEALRWRTEDDPRLLDFAVRITPLSSRVAATMAAILGYSYFFYRGFFSFVMAVPLAIGSLAALTFVGVDSKPMRMVGAALAALVLAILAGLAHPAALVFLMGGVICACLVAPWRMRLAGATLLVALGVLFMLGRIAAEGPTLFSGPLEALMRFLRTFGITHTFFEALFAVPIALLVLVGLVRGWRAAIVGFRGQAHRLSRTFETLGLLWPVLASTGLLLLYPFVPFEYGGAAGLNERLPVFSGLLALPFVPLPEVAASRKKVALAASAGFVVFVGYTAVINTVIMRRAEKALDAVMSAAIPSGSSVYALNFDNNFGSRGSGIGERIGAWPARLRGYLTGAVFCTHPAHPIRCKSRLPRHPIPPLQRFDRLSPSERDQAIIDPNHEMRGVLDRVADNASHYDYLFVIWPRPSSAAVRAAVDEVVVQRVHAHVVHDDPHATVYRF